MSKTLSSAEIQEFQSQINENWTHVDNKLRLVSEFKDFQEAVNFINKIAKLAQDLNHHPDLCLYQYKYIRIDIYTHTASGLTKLDFDLAKNIEEILNK